MRSKVILIRGFWNLSPEITSAHFERVNADSVLVITALKYPQHMPEPWNKFSIDTSTIDIRSEEILAHIRQEGTEHQLLAQYAEIATERGLGSIRSVEGDVLKVDWFYEAVKTYHKTFGQCVCVCDLQYHHKDHAVVAEIDGVLFKTRKEVVDRLGQSDILG